jgi:thiol-disulfide isomerase/thioredoxin
MKIIEIDETNSSTFDDEILKGPAFVKFYMTGCIHCEHVKPTWEALVKEMENDTRNLSLINVNSNAINNIKWSNIGEVQGFPTIIMIYDGGNLFKMYEGDRSLEDMKKFIDNFLNKGMSGGKRRRNLRKKSNKKISKKKIKSKSRKYKISKHSKQYKKRKTKKYSKKVKIVRK